MILHFIWTWLPLLWNRRTSFFHSEDLGTSRWLTLGQAVMNSKGVRRKDFTHYSIFFVLFFSSKQMSSRELIYYSWPPLSLSISVHVHSESILPLPRGYTGSHLQHGHWHVESGLHPCWTLHRLSSLPRRKWGGTDSLYNGGMTQCVCIYANVGQLLHCVKLSWYFKFQVLGMPPNDFVQSASRRRLFFGENLPSDIFQSFCCYCCSESIEFKICHKRNT